MNKMLALTAAGLLGLGLCPALAQTSGTAGQTDGSTTETTAPAATTAHGRRHHGAKVVSVQSDTGARPGHEPGVGDSYPASTKASNIEKGNTRSEIAPRLPNPAAGETGAPEEYLRDAQRALAAKKTGQAQEALERAQTRLLDRSVPQGETNTPANDPMIATVEQARQALGRGDTKGANRLIAQALSGHS